MGRRAYLLPVALMLLSGCIPRMASERYEPAPPERTVPRPTATPTPRPGLQLEPGTIPNGQQSWEMRPVTPDAREVPASTYVVRNGDSLRLIAVKTGAGSEAIARANGLAPPYTIQPGQRLQIPAGRYHIVRDGETGIAIARAYGVDWGRVVTVNYLEEPYILRTGQRILIPDAGPETLEQRAARFHLDIDDIVTGGQPALAANQRPRTPTTSPSRPLPPTATVATPARLSTPFQWPVQGTVVKRFGPGASGEVNDGIKIAVPLDTPILAAADGVVAYAGGDIPALGGLVILRHGDAWTTVYGHAGQILVRRGQSVKRGQMIALSGNSGFAADRPEVHFEIRQGRTPVDPLPRLPAR
ncbi:M23 family metallopeptidase [Sphingomonas sp. LB-2]|uniref:M23 family metallopeptidase n=1 Tax=Sphingomonas caeni TaxID=2984949 RepID=UPI002230C242|nr:M23 family metallopeptidase [Sphingomonas caeni]MCW3849246.1 M23 family metallopeptidase [Sphingomonas caeni]